MFYQEVGKEFDLNLLMRCCFRTFLFLMSLISMFKQGTEFLTLNKIYRTA